MGKVPWRLILDPPGEATWNMAVDEAVFEAVCTGQSMPTLRLYQWAQEALTVGRFQNLARTVNTDQWRSSGIPLVRRITGGRGILHGHDLTVSIAASNLTLGLPDKDLSTTALYTTTTRFFISWLGIAGINAKVGNQMQMRHQEWIGDCFAIAAVSDIVDTETGQKLLGAAVHRRGKEFLLQASIPLSGPRSNANASLILRTRSGSGAIANGNTPYLSMETLRNSVVEALSMHFGIGINVANLGCEESARAKDLVNSRYSNAEWNMAGIWSVITAQT